MTLFYSELKFINRFWTYFKLRLILILVVYLIFSFSFKSINPLKYELLFQLISFLYISMHIILSFLRTRYFIRKIEYLDCKFLVSFQDKNKNETFIIENGEFNPKLFLYDAHTRSTNHYLEFETPNGKKIKQYDYNPWTRDKMKEVIEAIDNINKKAYP